MIDEEKTEEEKQDMSQQELYRFWCTEIDRAKEDHETYFKRVSKIYDMLACINKLSDDTPERRFNVYWSSLESAKPSIFSNIPQVSVQRRQAGRNKIKRLSAHIAEAAGNYSVEEDQDFAEIANESRDDFLIAGRCVLWERYEFEEGTVTEKLYLTEQELATGFIEQLEEPLSEHEILSDESGPFIEYETTKKVSEHSVTDYVLVEDFLHNRARKQTEIRWKARRHYMTRDELVESFGDIGKKVKLQASKDDDKEVNERVQKKYSTAEVWEIWEKATKQVVFISKGYQLGPLKVESDPLALKGFYPCAFFISGTKNKKNLIPTPEYAQVQDQANIINALTERVYILAESLRVVGVYPSDLDPIIRSLFEKDNELVPVINWPRFQERGALEVIQWLPLDRIRQALGDAQTAREQELAKFYEMTGYSDLMRGVSDARETATAQQLKHDMGSPRLRKRQKDFQRFLAAQIRIKVEVVVSNFDNDRLLEIVGLESFGEQIAEQEFTAALDLLRNDYQRCYVIDIETDSTIASDEAKERSEITEFMGAFTPLVGQFLPIIQSTPVIGPALLEVILGVLRRYRFGRTVEAVVEQSFSQMIQTIQQQQEQAAQQPPTPDPLTQQLQMQSQVESQKNQISMAKAQMEAQQRSQIEGAKLELEREKMRNEFWLELEKLKLLVTDALSKMRLDIKQGGVTGETADENQILVAPGQASPSGIPSQPI